MIWLSFSLFTLSLFIFQHSDEVITRRDIIFILFIVLTGTVFGLFLLKKVKRLIKIPSILVSLIISFFLCLYIENKNPVTVFPPQIIKTDIRADADNNFDLTWCYWAQPNRIVNNEIADWHPVNEIRKDHLFFEGDWTDEGEFMRCTGQCSFSIKMGFTFSRPAFAFISNGHPIITLNDIETKAEPWSQMRMFAAGAGFSRQLVFLMMFFTVTGILNFVIMSAGWFVALLSGNLSYKSFELTNALLYSAAFLVPVVVVLIICWLLHFYPNGEKTFLLTDMQSQYVDYLIYFRKILNGEKSLFYSFSKSLGDDFLSIYAYYLGNLLNWITALFPIDRMPDAIALIILIRYGLCGLSSAVYFRKVYQAKGETLIFSTAYALISLQFVIIEHIQLRDGAILLPIILLGIEQLISNNRKILYILSLSAALLISYYSAYQICFFCVLFVLFRMFMQDKFSLKTAGSFLISSLTAAGLCAAFLIPVAIQLTKGMKTFDPSMLTLELNMQFSELAGKLFNSAFDLDQTLTSGFPNIYCGLLPLTGLPLFFINRSIRGKEKILCAGMLLIFISAMQIRALNIILHGFNEPVWWPYRYSFIICFFLIMLALRTWQERSGINLISWGLSLILVFGLLLFTHSRNFSWFSRDSFYLNLMLLAALYVLWYYTISTGKNFHSLILFISCLDLFLNGWMILEIKTAEKRTESINAFRSFFEENQSVPETLKTKDNGFYRIEKTYFRDANDALTLDYHGIGHYSSTLNYDLMKFLPKMGYRYFPWRFLYAEGSDQAADSLMGIRYLVSKDENTGKAYPLKYTINGQRIFQNPYSLPIAFWGQDIRIQDANSTTFELQNAIFRALTGETEPIYTRADTNDPVFNNLQISEEDNNCYERIEKSEDASISFHFSKQTIDPLYLYMQNDSDKIYPIEIYLNGSYLIDYFDGQGIPIIPLPADENQTELSLTLVPKADSICFDEFQLYAEDSNVLQKYASSIGKKTIRIEKNSETSLSGEINAEKNGFLIFSIPYDKSWILQIDGNRADLEKAFDVFLAAHLSAGQHKFELNYRPEGLYIGCAVSAGTVFFSIIYHLFKKRKGESIRNGS